MTSFGSESRNKSSVAMRIEMCKKRVSEIINFNQIIKAIIS